MSAGDSDHNADGQLSPGDRLASGWPATCWNSRTGMGRPSPAVVSPSRCG